VNLGGKRMHTVLTLTYPISRHSLVNITDKGIQTLTRLNCIAAFDFRSDPEIERQGLAP
jgi:hypothetical protein